MFAIGNYEINISEYEDESMSNKGLYKNYIKRILDIALSTVALIVLSPLLLITAILVRIKLGSPVIFKQPRPGKDEKIFYLLKFRSMTNEVGEDGRLLPDSQRLTKFGKFLRASSLDELLELINIIRGDMSIVGPRPLSIFYLPHYPSDLRKRHDVRPGLTGLAQVNGRNNLPWDDRFAMDIEYVDNLSFGLDVKIILGTVLKVLKHSDVAVRGANQVKDYGPYCVLKEEGEGGNRMADMTFSEIGSYFWLNGTEETGSRNEINWLPSMNDSCFTFSGRNAIDVVIRDILKNQRIDVVYAPSYCCISMLQEFVDRGLKIVFYDINFENGKFTYQIPEVLPHSVILIMSYFGLNTTETHREIERLHNSGALIIEDITHSLLRKDSVSNSCDYTVASLRKWFPIPTGGWAGKKNGVFSEKPELDSNHAVEEKIAAMKEKFDYLTGKVDSKENFLLTQAKFENDLIHVDRMLKIDDVSLSIIEHLNIDEIINRRRQNAEILINGLNNLFPIIQVPEIDIAVDIPLFVPVLMETEKRDSLRKYLIGRGIYCPVHWPEVMGATVGIRANELSLICDQRYSVGDMKAIVETIKHWYDELF